MAFHKVTTFFAMLCVLNSYTVESYCVGESSYIKPPQLIIENEESDLSTILPLLLMAMDNRKDAYPMRYPVVNNCGCGGNSGCGCGCNSGNCSGCGNRNGGCGCNNGNCGCQNGGRGKHCGCGDNNCRCAGNAGNCGCKHGECGCGKHNRLGPYELHKDSCN